MIVDVSTSQARTQSQRRESTQAALLDATIECLIEDGYAATTTRSVAKRAQVSQGAQQHYFPTKGKLVDAAIGRMIEQLVAESVAQPVVSADERDRAAEMLDRLWELHNMPVTPAVLEMFNLARTDVEVGRRVVKHVGQGMAAIHMMARVVIPTYAARPGFEDLIHIALATMRGTVVLSKVPGADSLHPSWLTVRSHLLDALDRLIEH